LLTVNYLSNAISLQRKQFAKDLVTLWCDAITRNEGDAFATEWVLGDAVLETLKKKRRQGQGETAAVADPADTDQAAVADAGGESMIQ
jgi:hypothetical protein